MDASPFKTPSSTPQDLLLIQDLIGDFLPPPPPKAPPRAVVAPVDSDSDIASTSSEAEDEDEDSDVGESETEVSKDLLDLTNDEGSGSAPSPSDSEPASDSDDDEIPSLATKKAQPLDDDGDDEDETGTSLAPGAVPQTKNELPDVEINIPDVEEVGPDEPLEKVGEIMSILDERVVIVKGKESSIANRGAESALDSDTLLIFDDRKTLGYIYETFGPTSQPFYQVKFNQKYPLDVSKVQLGREVFHVPTRSRFVFLRDIQHLKGSDASNLYDEEPAEHELEYSDDEAEAAAKSRRKRTRGESRSRAGSVSSSRFSTPGPSQMRDQEMNYMNGDAYAAHGPYDIDFTGTSSRPPPMPYDDDPYADIPTATPNDDSPSSPPKPSPNDSRYPEPSMSRGDADKEISRGGAETTLALQD
ncbi:hypothetical protein ONZ45_g15914 [Pleurotus djamor]|nr:hypothetical protein ONZ45_g15914 [Pleurotus djamor]